MEDNQIFDHEKFPFNESDKYEFKASIDKKSFDKYLKIICGFFNTGGGNLIFGIKDNLDLIGLKITSKDLDTFILRIDSIINEKHIIGIDIINNNQKILKFSNIKIKQITNNNNKFFLLIQIIPENNTKYQLLDGSVFYRLGASTYFERNEKLYRPVDFENICKNYQQKMEQDNKQNIKLFQKSVKEKDDQIKILNDKITEMNLADEIYQKYLENTIKYKNNNLNKNLCQNQIINYNYVCIIWNNVIDIIQNNIFSCFST